MKVNYSISTKVVIILFFSILASMTLSGIFSYIFERQKMIKNSEESVEQISNSLIYNLANPMWNYDEISVNDIIDLEIKNSILSALIIRDESESVSYMRVKDADKNIVNYAPFDLDKKQFYKIVKGEIKYKHEVVGYITLYFNNSILSDRLSTSIMVIILQVLLVSFIAISILFLSLKKSFLEPVIVINNAVEKFAKKDFNARINYKSEDEIGHLAESFNNMASTLQLYSETMEAIVEERTKELVQSEKMASLGGLVAGIAHEINTPVGIAVTASSHLLKKTGDFTELYKNNLMKRSDLDGYIEVADESTQLILNNLEKASSLIQSFKQVAVDQSSEEKRTFRIKEYIEDVLVSLKPKLKRHNHNITIESE
ncbi:MAG TPA: HAMP domain-containing protein, partial [Spirochaetota bacterium]|nr:HAMP domain-containing protein [Spirochaetota bacterium]